jgi:hypothetical protein
MLNITKNYIIDENQQTIAVQIPIAEFERIEQILEDYGLAKLMEETFMRRKTIKRRSS